MSEVAHKLLSIAEKQLLAKQLREELAYSMMLQDVFPDAFTDDKPCNVKCVTSKQRKLIRAREGVTWVSEPEHYVITNNKGVQCCVSAAHWNEACDKFMGELQ